MEGKAGKQAAMDKIILTEIWTFSGLFNIYIICICNTQFTVNCADI